MSQSYGCSCNIDDKMMEIESVKIDETMVIALEKAFYEYNGLLNALVQFSSDSPYKPDMERYELLLNEYLESFAKYNIIFNTIYAEAIVKVPKAKQGVTYESTVDFTNECINIHLNNILVNKK